MGIALVADIEDQFVFGEVETMMQGDDGFNRAKVRGKMPAINGSLLDDLFSKCLAKALHLLIIHMRNHMVAWEVI